jgi:peptidyl-tRNA hydrolase, PTH1 family
MKLIVGLGNPGAEYAGTRHNVGFELVDLLASAHRIKVDSILSRARIGRGTVAEQAVLLAKPLTYMNLSGEAVKGLKDREGVELSDILVVTDDIHLPVGRVRLRASGSSGGQNGLKSIAAQLGTQDFARLRIGVGEPPPGLQVEWVLGKFGGADRKVMDETLIVAMGAVEVWLREGVEPAMNRFNNVVVALP